MRHALPPFLGDLLYWSTLVEYGNMYIKDHPEDEDKELGGLLAIYSFLIKQELRELNMFPKLTFDIVKDSEALIRPYIYKLFPTKKLTNQPLSKAIDDYLFTVRSV